MREYGQVQCSLWGHPDIQTLSDQGKLLATYLLSSPHSNGLGCYRLPTIYVQADLGWTPETTESAFTEIESINFGLRCHRTGFILIPNYLRWNPISNSSVAVARQKEYREIPSQFTLRDILVSAMLQHGAHWKEPFLSELQDTARQGNRYPSDRVSHRVSDGVSDTAQTRSQEHAQTPCATQDPTRPDPTPPLSRKEWEVGNG